MKRSSPLKRRIRLSQRGTLTSVTDLEACRPLQRRTEIRPQSDKARRMARQRSKVVSATFAEDQRCQVPDCTSRADDVHEPITRARGGSVMDPGNMLAVCRDHHREIHDHPGWAQTLGLLRPSGGDAA